jgi:selenocysteine lyase/cysteine desulfurase
VGINYADIKGIRITPNIYTTPDEIDRFAEVLELAAQGKIPEVAEG